MKLNVNRRLDAQAHTAAQAVFLAPGGTIGRAAENQLVLADAPDVCRVQAALRYGDGGWRLANLSAMGTVSVNGVAVQATREQSLENGDEVAIGPYVMHVETDSAQDGATQAKGDVFSDLIGPGTLPVASMSDLGVHPFDMESAISRNPDDPLAQLQDHEWRHDAGQRDPLALFPDQGGSAYHALSDPTPAMLPADDPLASRRLDPIAETLRGGTGASGQRAMRDDAPEYGNPMTPPRVRR
ncbi:FHA domain-containing protein [Bordetella sp. H567]|uniref:FHA domain-containing protein n=1 Tax=Bordetella sp. H567 TaxID=1697043 RepID=UPI00082BAA96|nr:FHA domain-containing protein [Bordetella sp. H567]